MQCCSGDRKAFSIANHFGNLEINLKKPSFSNFFFNNNPVDINVVRLTELNRLTCQYINALWLPTEHVVLQVSYAGS